MHGAVKQQTVTIEESNKANNGNLMSIQDSIRKYSYADAAKEGIKHYLINGTPRSSKPTRTPQSIKPVIAGKSTKSIGKPLSPHQSQRSNRSGLEKAVWISGIHRDTTEEELSSYITESLGIAPAEFDVRKLVKKGSGSVSLFLRIFPSR